MTPIAHNLEARRFTPERPIQRPRGFTLIELVVVVSIIVLLASVLLPSLSMAIALTRRDVCVNNVRGIGLATQFYIIDNSYYPPAWINGTCRWMDLIKPYTPKTSGLYRCPADPKQIPCTWDATITMSYGINTFDFQDNAHCFWYVVKASDVKRPAETIIFADCTPGKYYCGGGSVFNQPVVSVDYRHPNSSFVANLCDGRALSEIGTTQRDWDASQ